MDSRRAGHTRARCRSVDQEFRTMTSFAQPAWKRVHGTCAKAFVDQSGRVVRRQYMTPAKRRSRCRGGRQGCAATPRRPGPTTSIPVMTPPLAPGGLPGPGNGGVPPKASAYGGCLAPMVDSLTEDFWNGTMKALSALNGKAGPGGPVARFSAQPRIPCTGTGETISAGASRPASTCIGCVRRESPG
jgi:hypothetical protein